VTLVHHSLHCRNASRHCSEQVELGTVVHANAATSTYRGVVVVVVVVVVGDEEEVQSGEKASSHARLVHSHKMNRLNMNMNMNMRAKRAFLPFHSLYT
jgi:hypothetical protein